MKRHQGMAVLSVALASFALAVPAWGGAQTTCTYQGGIVRVRLLDDGSSSVIARTGAAITENGDLCGAATILNTNEINVRDMSNGGSTSFLIDLSGGDFSNGVNDISFQINLRTGTRDVFGVAGSDNTDFMTFGRDGANLQNDATAEVEFLSTPDLGIAAGRRGGDRICAKGDNGTGASSNVVWGIVASYGADVVCGGDSFDLISGGPGPDRIAGGAGPDNVRGNGGADRLAGQRAPDSLYGGAGDDELHGGGGRDLCRGGPGDDVENGC
jgi:Ca2+-binding RTX toxin-like protein